MSGQKHQLKCDSSRQAINSFRMKDDMLTVGHLLQAQENDSTVIGQNRCFELFMTNPDQAQFHTATLQVDYQIMCERLQKSSCGFTIKRHM